jgi:leucine dehydrogenase
MASRTLGREMEEVGEAGQAAPPLVPGTRAELGHEVVLCHDRASGLNAAIAIDDTTLGPGLGGVRWMSYPSFATAVEEACRLARVMTLKNALTDLPYGGAKAVIARDDSLPATPARRTAQVLAFAATVARLGDLYVPGVDMGTSVADLALMATIAPHVSCTHDDPSPATATGVFNAIEATVRQLMERDLVGLRVAVQGAGHVGASLAAQLAQSGATVFIADVNGARAAEVARLVGGIVVEPEKVLSLPCDVLAPCASARVLHPVSIEALSCAAVVGAANDVLADRSCDALLARRGIVYVPDFVTNAGGVIHIHAERAGWDGASLDTALTAIGPRTTELLRTSASRHTTPLVVAESWASDRLGRTVTIPD